MKSPTDAKPAESSAEQLENPMDKEEVYPSIDDDPKRVFDFRAFRRTLKTMPSS